jgi:hypothetical protein
VVHCLRLRWRQENSFKFLSEHYAVDQIVQYGAEPETQDRLLANPKRKALQVRACLQRIQALQAQLGGALDHNEESRRATVRGLKIAAANAESMLVLRFDQSYQRPQNVRSVFRALLQLPGQVTATAPDRL